MSKELKSVLVGMDFTEPSDNAIREAARIAKWDHAMLTAVHVFDEHVLDLLDPQAPGLRADVLAEAEGRMAARLEEILGPENAVGTHFGIGHTLEEMTKAVKQHAADLLVLGSHGTKSSDEFRIGILASRSLRKVPVNVMLVRDRQAEPFRRIAACVDFSPTSIKAVAHAVHMARQDDASLELIHINPAVDALLAQASYLTAVVPPTTADFEQKNIENLHACLHELYAEAAEGTEDVPYETTVLTDIDPHERIIAYLNRSTPDLVVVGTRGKTNLKNLLLGSTAEKIIHLSPSSVLAIKPDGFDYELT